MKTTYYPFAFGTLNFGNAKVYDWLSWYSWSYTKLEYNECPNLDSE